MTREELDKIALTDELPCGLDIADLYYLKAMKVLYHAYSMNAIDKDYARQSKALLVKEYEDCKEQLKYLYQMG